MEDRCVCCGEIVTEGRQVCPQCEKKVADLLNKNAHGRWLAWKEKFPETTLKAHAVLGVFCSVCENHADYPTDYCPNCGAKMDLPRITDQTKAALEAMGRKAHGGDCNGS